MILCPEEKIIQNHFNNFQCANTRISKRSKRRKKTKRSIEAKEIKHQQKQHFRVQNGQPQEWRNGSLSDGLGAARSCRCRCVKSVVKNVRTRCHDARPTRPVKFKKLTSKVSKALELGKFHGSVRICILRVWNLLSEKELTQTSLNFAPGFFW